MKPLAHGVATIFMLHRFSESGERRGHPITLLRRQLAHLRRRRYRLIALPDLLTELGEPGRALPPTVAFTVDDGYEDFVRLAAPVFAEFDCPVTAFLATGFVDGKLWLWWDRVRYSFTVAQSRACRLTLGGHVLSYRWACTAEALACASEIVNRLEHVEDAERRTLVARLPEMLGADVPPVPTSDYAPMTWPDVRALSQGSRVTFGPHTVSHPILARMSADEVAFEIDESWRRVKEETRASAPIFCYPNGQHYAVGERERAAVARSGLAGAVTAAPRYARVAARGDTSLKYQVPRFACPEDHARFRHIVSGVERLKAPLRSVLGM